MRRNSRWFTLILFTCILFVAACSSDDSDSPAPSSNEDNNGSDNGDKEVPGNNLGTGESAQELLSDEEFKELKVEILYMEGAAPNAASVNNFSDFLDKYLRKPDGIQIIERQIPSGGQSSYSVEDIKNIEEEHREEYNRENVMAASLILVDGDYSANENVLGIAYQNTSMALFQATINRHTGGVGQPSKTKVESAVINHEFGHIAGLVNNGTPTVEDHHDEAHGAHCDNEDCLMYYAVETTDVLENLIGSSVPDLDQNCRQDISANGGK